LTAEEISQRSGRMRRRVDQVFAFMERVRDWDNPGHSQPEQGRAAGHKGDVPDIVVYSHDAAELSS